MTGERSVTLAAAGVCVIAAIWLALLASDARRLEQANQAGAAGRYDAAISAAQLARHEPARTQALLIEARAHRAAGRLRPAIAAYRRFIAREPNLFGVHREFAVTLYDARRGREALAEIERARELNPRVEVPRAFADAARRDR